MNGVFRLLPFLVLLATPAWACTSVDGLPDPTCTPGSSDPAVTQENVGSTMLSARLVTLEAVRPPVSVTNKMKRQVMQEYGMEGEDPHQVEGDHDVSIELGGCPGPDRGCDFHANFWPEPWTGPDNAHDKDHAENALHRLVCSGRLPLGRRSTPSSPPTGNTLSTTRARKGHEHQAHFC